MNLKLSVLIVTQRRFLMFYKCIRSVYRSSTPEQVDRIYIALKDTTLVGRLIKSLIIEFIYLVYSRSITIQYFNCSGLNVGHSRDFLIEKSTAELFTFLDDDDEFLEDTIHHIIHPFIVEPTLDFVNFPWTKSRIPENLVKSRSFEIDTKFLRNRLSDFDNYNEDRYVKYYPCACCKVLKRSKYLSQYFKFENDIYDDNVPMLEYLMGSSRYVQITTPLYYYNSNHSRITKNRSVSEITAITFQNYIKLLNRFDDKFELINLIIKDFYNHYRSIISHYPDENSKEICKKLDPLMKVLASRYSHLLSQDRIFIDLFNFHQSQF